MSDYMKRAISYLRASDSEVNQPNSIAVQRAIVESFATRFGYAIEKEFSEYASGTNNERQAWNESLQYAQEHNCYTLIWRVDRYTRSLASFAKTDSVIERVRFAELGNVVPSPLVMSVLVATGQNEAENARIRIKTTMALLKERDGRVWGNPRIQETALPASIVARKQSARLFNDKITGLVADLRKAGYSLKGCVERLNNLGFQTRRGKPWTYHLLYRVIHY